MTVGDRRKPLQNDRKCWTRAAEPKHYNYITSDVMQLTATNEPPPSAVYYAGVSRSRHRQKRYPASQGWKLV